MSEHLDPDISLPFPIEFVIRDTPRSLQAKKRGGNELWKQRVDEITKAHVNTLSDFFLIGNRPLAVAIFYFPPTKTEGDIDNIAKLIIDEMRYVIYLDDQCIERVIVQKFEPRIEAVFQSLTPTLEQALGIAPPVIYIRIDDDLSWRQVR